MAAQSWWAILKGLLFDGGPSSTRWVYLFVCVVVNLCLMGMVFAFCWVFARGKAEAATFAIAATVITSTISVVIGFATSAQKNRNQLTGASTAEAGANPQQETTSGTQQTGQ